MPKGWVILSAPTETPREIFRKKKDVEREKVEEGCPRRRSRKLKAP